VKEFEMRVLKAVLKVAKLSQTKKQEVKQPEQDQKPVKQETGTDPKYDPQNDEFWKGMFR
jgi:hypothetical protein